MSWAFNDFVELLVLLVMSVCKHLTTYVVLWAQIYKNNTIYCTAAF